jgi:limonene-1,2-epoxide hydrolase
VTADVQRDRQLAALKAHDSLPARHAAFADVLARYELALEIDDPSAAFLMVDGMSKARAIFDDLLHAIRAEDAAHVHHIAAVRGRVRDQLHAARLVEVVQAFVVAFALEDPVRAAAAFASALGVLRDETDERVHGAAAAAGRLGGAVQCAAELAEVAS